jgi:hypothetical protein
MVLDPRQNLIAELPAGEWADVQVLNQPPGMMAGRNWAVFAKAKWLRRGGRSAFIKFIIPAGSQAGSDTEIVTGGERLKRLCERLQAINAIGKAVPLVPLLEVRLTPRGLLIAMEEVTPLSNIIERGESYDLSLQVLRDLDPESEGNPAWLHFDICPLNIGVLHDNRCVLIDVESFYLEEGGRHYDVSVPAWKYFRAPHFLVREVNEKLDLNDTDRPLAVKKVGFEVALAAAECVLGPLLPSRGGFTEALLESWVANADSGDPAVEFWHKELQHLLRTGQVRPVRDMARRLEAALQQGRAPIHAPRVTVAALKPESERSVEVSMDVISVELEQDVPAGWETDWLLLKPSAHALRAGKFDQVRIAEYRSALERLVQQYPARRELWDELLLLTVSYQKDPIAALAIAGSALGHFPNDAEFERQRNIIQKWAMERQNENNAG